VGEATIRLRDRSSHRGLLHGVTFQGETETVSGLDRMLSLADEVVRHKIVRLGDD